jgi:hypothetical protein
MLFTYIFFDKIYITMIKKNNSIFKEFKDTSIILVQQTYYTLYPMINDMYNSKKSYSLTNLNNSFSVITKFIKTNYYCLPLFFELYFVIYHVFIVRLWIVSNLLCTVLFMYDKLSDQNFDKRMLPIKTSFIKNFTIFVIVFGIVLVIYFMMNIDFLMVFLFSYLITRSYKNVLSH